ncbi:MAG: hypothetical protein LUO89_04240 [Methanothrix sp.]|nr:hypothetical protein [Methanothrix sp.]
MRNFLIVIAVVLAAALAAPAAAQMQPYASGRMIGHGTFYGPDGTPYGYTFAIKCSDADPWGFGYADNFVLHVQGSNDMFLLQQGELLNTYVCSDDPAIVNHAGAAFDTVTAMANGTCKGMAGYDRCKLLLTVTDGGEDRPDSITLRIVGNDQTVLNFSGTVDASSHEAIGGF